VSRIGHPAVERNPFNALGAVVTHEEGTRLVAERVWRPADDPFLYDHAIGHIGEAWDGEPVRYRETWLPLMPLMLLVEVAGQGATALVPGKRVVGFRDVKSRAFVPLEDDHPLRLRTEVVRDRIADQVTVSCRRASSDTEVPLFDATVMMAGSFSRAPLPALEPLVAPQSAVLTASGLYKEVLFHGRAFQSVSELIAVGENGLDARIRSPGPRAADWVAEPLLLDALPQLVNYWCYERIDPRYWGFLFQVGQVHLRRPLGELPGTVTARIRLRALTDEVLSAEAELVDDSGEVWMLASGMLNGRRESPPHIFDFIKNPERTAASFEVPAEDESLIVFAESTFARFEPPVYRQSLEWLTHTRPERIELAAHGPQRRAQLASERIAAKDCIRTFLRRHHGLTLQPCDLQLAHDGKHFRILSQLPEPLSLSTCSLPALSVAVAGRPSSGLLRVGLALGLTRESGDGDPVDSCVLSAVRDALGSEASRNDLKLVSRDAGVAHVRLSGTLAKRFPNLASRSLIVEVLSYRDHIVAVCSGQLVPGANGVSV
jgi:Polyketide synthase dehydratase